mgnify:CR=1 FL=1
MQISKKTSVYTALLTVLFTFSCTNRSAVQVLDPSYSSYQSGDEKGYVATFSLPHQEIVPTYIVLNRLHQNIETRPDSNGYYSVRVIAESRKINHFRPEVTSKENGIGYQSGKNEFFIPVRFKKREHSR